MGNAVAYLKWGVSGVAKSFASGFYVVGGNAYCNNNTLLTSFTKSRTTTKSNDSFNFHLSQIRIRVEMAFGLLVNKWRILRRRSRFE